MTPVVNPVVRCATGDDQAAVIAVWQAAGITRPWNDPGHDFRFALAADAATVLVAVEQDVILATAMVGHDGHRGWVHYLAVQPGVQRGGLGRQMMDAAEAWLAARGLWKVQLLVRQDNAGVLDFYERLGYRDTRSVCLQKILSVPTISSVP